MNHNTKCSILVASCDAYIDILPVFFTLLKRYWPDLKYEIFLSTESIDYRYPDIKIINIHPKQPNVSWTERIYDAISKIDSRQIFLLCDDFFLYDKVNSHKIRQIISWLQSDKSIACFSLWPFPYGNSTSPFEDFFLRPKKAKYKVAIIASLWNKKWLQKYLRNIQESAWQFEPNANLRSYKMFFPGKFYAMKTSQNSIFPYNFSEIGLFSGKWLPKTKQIFQQNNIKIDFTQRGFFDNTYRILQPSVQQAFLLNSSIFPSCQKNSPRLFLPKINILDKKRGILHQEYHIKQGASCFRWNISDITGYSLSNLTINISYKNGTKEQLKTGIYYGTFLKLNNKFIFNSYSPFITALTDSMQQFKKITIDASIKLPATKNELKKSYNIITSYSDSPFESVIYHNELEYDQYLKTQGGS